MNCDNCGAELPEEGGFCGQCGAPFSTTHYCGECGAKIRPGARFCPACGATQGAGGVMPQLPGGKRPGGARPGGNGGGSSRLLAIGLVLALLLVGGVYVLSSGKDSGSSKPLAVPTSTVSVAASASKPTAGPASLPVALQPTGAASSPSPQPSKSGPEKVEAKAPDASALIQTSGWGEVPANQIGIVLKDGLNRADAEQVAQGLGGKIVGELTYIALYQIEFPSKGETDLKATLSKAKATAGVELAFPLQQVTNLADIKGVGCDPFKESAYEGNNALPYKMIGVEKAWQILRASGVDLSPVKVGITDDGLYKGKGEFSGATKFEAPDKEDALSDALKDSKGVENPRGSHGTAVASILAADPDNGGISGVGSVLGDRMSVTMSNIFGSQYGGKTVAKADPSDPTVAQIGSNTYSIGPLVALKKQVDSGATIINCSWGTNHWDQNGNYLQGNADMARAYRKFFEKMAKDHPNVLFVAAAGNDGKAVNGSGHWPGGAPLPNMITVGNLDSDGTRWKSSNMNGNDFEVTLGAPGHRVPAGRGPDGKISNEYGGTSFAAPQVSAAAAMLRSINPRLTAADIKKILVETAATETDVSGKKVPIDASVGGRVLRVDNAVLRVINDLRKAKQPPLPELKMADLEKIGVIDAVAQGKSPTDYTIRATLGGASDKATEVSIQARGQGTIVVGGESKKRSSVPGEVTWGLSLGKPTDEAFLLIRRLDNSACVTIHVKPQSPLAGQWKGSATLTDVVMPGLEGAPPELIAQVRTAMGIGQSFPFDATIKEETLEAGKIAVSGSGGEADYGYTFKAGQFVVDDMRFSPVLTKSRLVGQLRESGGSYTIEGSWTSTASQGGQSVQARGNFKMTKVQ